MLLGDTTRITHMEAFASQTLHRGIDTPHARPRRQASTKVSAASSSPRARRLTRPRPVDKGHYARI